MADSDNQDKKPQEDPIAQLKQEMVGLVNSAITTHIKRNNEKQEKKLEELGSMLAKLLDGKTSEAHAQEPEQAPPEQAAKAPGVDKKTQQMAIELQNQMAAQQRQIQQMKQILQEKEDAMKAAELARRDVEARTKLAAALRTSGVRDELIDPAVSWLYVDKKKVLYNQEGQLVFVHEGPYGEVEKPVDQGVGAWLEGEGKHYLPPRDVKGTGVTGGQAPSGPGKQPDLIKEMINLLRD